MGILNQVLQLLFSLSLLIVLHELGHFIPAKIFKTRVEKFYLFFPAWFSLYKKKIGETTYGIGWLPLGGFVKISGMVDESMDKEAMKEEPKPWEFRSKPAWQRLIIMLGGVFVNVVVAIAIYIMVMFVYGQTVIPNKSVVDGIEVPQKAFSEAIGLKTGDRIIEIDGVNYNEESIDVVINNLPYAHDVKVNRDGDVVDVKMPENFIEIITQHRGNGGLFGLRRPFEVGEIQDSSNAKIGGLLEGDVVLNVDDKPIKYLDQFTTILSEKKSSTVNLLVKRNEETLGLNIEVTEEGTIGFIPMGISDAELKAKGFYEIKKIDYSLMEAIPAGFKETKDRLVLYVKGFMKILDFKTKAYKAAGGFKAFGGMFSTTWNWELIWRNTAFISIMLAFMNLLPIPALDGGHAMFLTYEIITGRKPHEKVMEYAQMAGMILLLGLVLIVNINDWI